MKMCGRGGSAFASLRSSGSLEFKETLEPDPQMSNLVIQTWF